MKKADIIVIGGGLSGLLLHYRLKAAGFTVIVLEGRTRWGGRIWTDEDENTTGIEMGATWLQANHTRLIALLNELGLEVFPQWLGHQAWFEQSAHGPLQRIPLPPNNAPSYRIAGGTSALIRALSQHLSPEHAYLDTIVNSIRQEEEGISLDSSKGMFSAKIIVSTLPPNLFERTIDIHPALPGSLRHLMRQTHTWMGESIKAGMAFPEAFWKQPEAIGTAFSHSGPFTEIYDHSNAPQTGFALMGFLHNGLASLPATERKALVLKQLEKLYGTEASHFSVYKETVWQTEPLTYAPYEQQPLPHQNNGHGDYRKAYWNGRLFLAGSETADAFPGYMEGAVRSAEWVYSQLT